MTTQEVSSNPFLRLLIAIALIASPVTGDETKKTRAGARSDSLENIHLRIEPDGWGNARPNDLSAVLHSSCSELAVHFEPDQLSRLEPIRIRNDEVGPMTHYQRTVRGEILVSLDSKNRFWCQHAYQMAHEFAHILCRTKKADRSNLWFEESLCELASIFALRQMALTWKTAPPYPNWKDYAKALDEYADNLLIKYTPRDQVSLEEWYQKHANELQTNATNRNLNGTVAVQLLPLLEKNPGHWEAVHYLNIGVDQKSKSFAEYLKAWYQHCPEQHKPFVDQVSEKFGVSL